MKIFAKGEKIRTDELQQKLAGVQIHWTIENDLEAVQNSFEEFDVIIDLSFDDYNQTLDRYAALKGKPVIVSAVKRSLAQVAHEYGKPVECVLVGINALPTFINRSLAEVSVLNQSDEAKEIFAALNWDIKIVNDRVGMVTPRVVLMIINEACYTVQEGTASMTDIDISMKLGTNYPMGPFEWGDKIGIRNIYETLESVYQDTHDERYKICPLLKTLYLQGRSFYQ